jgi:hypothetical protein
MNIIDIRNIGYISESDEIYLAELIASVCNDEKLELAIDTKNKFKWNYDYLIPYTLSRYMGINSFKKEGHISSGEWLCGVFFCKEVLTIEYMLLLLCFVNKNLTKAMVHKKRYVSGTGCWDDAPPVIKQILSIIDYNVSISQVLKVVIPNLKNKNFDATMIKNPNADFLRGKVNVVWPYENTIEFL